MGEESDEEKRSRLFALEHELWRTDCPGCRGMISAQIEELRKEL
jgi:hypothetical protein